MSRRSAPFTFTSVRSTSVFARLVPILASTFLMLARPTPAAAQTNIWAGTDVSANVELTPFLAEGKARTAVIVCPGGSYFWHDMETEGYDVARYLQSHGISAFVLRYRAAGVFAFVTRFRTIFRGRRYPDAQEDLLRAVRLVREQADSLGVDPARIGVMGFSAGGHLVMSAATYFPKEERPAFIVPIYPVVTMHAPYVHKRSRRALLGDSRKRNAALRDSLSLERHVPADCPPVFLANCKDDPIVDYHNSLLLDSALTAANVPHAYTLYPTGGHGFGGSEVKGSAEARSWKESFLRWLEALFKN